MRIGITFDLQGTSRPDPGGRPDDWDEEYDRPETIAALVQVLEAGGHEVRLLGDGPDFLRRVMAEPVDLVFNLAEGQGVGRCREARVPAALELLGIPYSGSDPLTLAATLDKDCAKRLIQAAGLPTPGWVLIDPAAGAAGRAGWTGRLGSLGLPLILKPSFEGSSKGIHRHSLIDDPAALLPRLAEMARHYDQPILAEQFIDGDEVTVGLIGNRPARVLGVMRVLPRTPGERFIYSLDVKRDYERRVRYECPARYPAAVLRVIEEAALGAFAALGCRDLARIDFRVRDGVPYFLEANPIPGLAPVSSDLMIMARQLRLGYPEVIGRILAAAIERHGLAG